jgi:hypothetical protein
MATPEILVVPRSRPMHLIRLQSEEASRVIV